MELSSIKPDIDIAVKEGLNFLANEPDFLQLTPEQRIGLAIQYSGNLMIAACLTNIQYEIKHAFDHTSYDSVLVEIKQALQVYHSRAPSIDSGDLYMIKTELEKINLTLMGVGQNKTNL